MKATMFTVLVVLLSLVFCTSVVAKCMMFTEDNGSSMYSCEHVTVDDISDIPDEAEWIEFIASNLFHLPERAFARFTLRKLSFYGCEMRHVNPKAFDGLHKLQQLIFYGSNIHVLKSSWFTDMNSLTYLFLDQNGMVYIEPDVFSSIPNLEYLNVEDNNLNCLTGHALKPLKKLKHVRIDKNPWLCTCYAELVEWIKNRQINYGVKNITETTLECMVKHDAEPGDFKMELDTIHKDSPAEETEYLSISPAGNVLCVGSKISVLSRIPENVQSIKFLNSQLDKIPQFAFFRFENSLRSLDLTNCNVNDIHPMAFAGLSKLENLILFNNSVSMVRAEWFKDLRALKNLAMDSNEIEHIQSSVFPLLDKLETLSLKDNNIGCFPLRAFTFMKHLKQMTIANNTWICRCLQDFRTWMNHSHTDYPVLPTQCTDKKMYRNGKQYVSGYRDASFRTYFENEERKIINDNAILALGGTLEVIEPFDGTFIEGASYENNSVKVTQEEGYHKRNKEYANVEYRHLQADQKQQQGYGHIPSEYSSLPCIKKSYVVVGGKMWDIAAISLDAEAIRFERSAIPKIVDDIFTYRHTLRILGILNCGLRKISPQAFEGLINLQELILDDNEINVVRTVWFESIPNLERLSLLRNSITRIENGVFQLLLNLKYFGISNNQLNCIGIGGLSLLKNLTSMNVGNNPWSCLCQIRLNQWLIEHKIQYDTNIFGKTADWYCIEEYQGSKIPQNKYHNKNSVNNERFDDDFELEESAIIQATRNSQGTKKIQKSKDVTNNSEILRTKDSTGPYFTITGMKKNVETPTTAECSFHQFNRMMENRWWCSNGDLSILDQIPSSAERIDVIDSNMQFIPADAFARFSNLTKLLFYNNSINDIEPLAFATLDKLEWLIFLDNNMSTVRSSWFHGLVNVTLLGLVGNSITEIEPDVFEYLPNLKRLSIQDKNLKCLYTKSLSSLQYLQRVTMQDNPWKWKCREELTQFFEARNISYVRSESYEENPIVTDLLTDESFASN